MEKGDFPLLLGPGVAAVLWTALKTGSPGWAVEAAAAVLCSVAGCLAALAVKGLAAKETGVPAAAEKAEKQTGENENPGEESGGESMFWRSREEQQKGGAAAPAWAEKVKPASAENAAAAVEPAGGQEQEAAAAEPGSTAVLEGQQDLQHESGSPEPAAAEPPRLAVIHGGCGAQAAAAAAPVPEQAACGYGAGQAAVSQHGAAPGGRAALDLFEAVRALVESVQLEEKETWAAVKEQGGRAAELAARLEAELAAALGTCREVRAALDELVQRVSARA